MFHTSTVNDISLQCHMNNLSLTSVLSFLDHYYTYRVHIFLVRFELPYPGVHILYIQKYALPPPPLEEDISADVTWGGGVKGEVKREKI